MAERAPADADGAEQAQDVPAAGNNVGFVAAAHAYQFLCLEDFELITEKCDCHGFDMRRVPMGVCCHPDGTGLGVYLWSRLEDDPTLEGVYFVAAWAAAMFTDFYPVFCPSPASGAVLGMVIYVPPNKVNVFVEAIAALGQMGALPCHYCRRMQVDFPEQKVHLISESWFVEAVNCLYYWQCAEWDAIMNN
ncbi:ORF22 [Fowl aviadenovirus D]|nr:ORF22 [Fowl aviadenovirus D]WQI83289.1 ORF22 [Fowl aviadenovirus D]